MAYKRKDFYHQKAKKEGKASRAAYKIAQLQKRLKFIKRGDTVIDLGCSPGGWLQEMSKLVGSKGNIVGIDIEAVRISVPDNVTFILGDIMSPDSIEQLCLRLTNEPNVIVSDMAPKLSGITFRDSYKSFELAQRAFEICQGILTEGGNFLVKIFPGKELDDYKKMLKKAFKKVDIIIPPATRKTSSEMYLVGLGYKKI